MGILFEYGLNSYIKIAMKVFVNNNGPSPVNVSADETVASLKNKLEVSDDASLSFAGQILQNEVSLLSAGVCELSTLSVSCELIGGKVHGSLARAGKVKGQTPKVEAGEKKKKTGRAARRQQYNRKFVNVVNTFGKARGPNSN